MKLAAYLGKEKITLEAFAEMIGVSVSSAHRYAKGLSYPRPPVAARIVEATKRKVKIEDLYKRGD